jgi:acyl-CoA synthetase (AMP-forming)/AMP-acid ligase II
MLSAELRRDPSRPLVTWYDDASGERVELSVATTANWVVKAANYLFDEHGVAAGEHISIDAPSHWMALVTALAAWTVGATIDLSPAILALPGEPKDFAQLVLPQPDVLLAPPVDPDSTALVAGDRSWTAGELAAAARHAAAAHGLGTGTRVLSTLAVDSVDGMDASLLVPLAAGGSVVLVAHADPDRLVARAAGERVTHTAGVTVPGLPRLG